MINLEKIKLSEYFKEISLKSGDVLFKEGDEDEFLYIVYDGELLIEKSTSGESEDFKTLGLLGIGNIVGEASLTRNEEKQVQISAHRESILLAIDAKVDFQKFLAEEPREAYNLLLAIIDLSNLRLLRANREVTANYEVSKAISSIHDFDLKTIFGLLETFKSILEADSILYFEKNMVMDEYYKLKYYSNKDSELENQIFKFPENNLSLDLLKKESIHLDRYTRNTPLFLGDENHGFLLIGREKKDFHENEEKLLGNTATNFVGVIRQKEILENERNKSYIKSI